MTTFTTEDKEEALKITALSYEMRKAFEKQFPDLVNDHKCWMAYREGWQAGAYEAYNEAYNLKDWTWA